MAEGHAMRRNPRKARFSAQPKIRPNNTLQAEALYSLPYVLDTIYIKKVYQKQDIF
jgi:hypothetical protein